MDFLKDGKRFSFKLGGANVWERPYTVEEKNIGNKRVFRYDFGGGLIVTNEVKLYEKFGACEWVNYIENVSDTPTDILSELYDCDTNLPLPYEEDRKQSAYLADPERSTKVYAPNGSTYTCKEFYCNVDELSAGSCAINYLHAGGEAKTYATCGGRSSYARAPYFNIHKEGTGYIVAVGWTGQWQAQLQRINEAVVVKTKIEDTHFRVLPGEKFRTSSVVILPYEGSVDDGQNLWRRLLKEEFSPIGKGERDGELPLCAGFWGGMASQTMLERIKTIRENNLPFEYVWIDAGWYGEDTKPTPNEFEGDWWQHTGDWRVSKLCHPNGLKDVSEEIHKAGMKFLLWFEPERVISNTPIVKEHPEYFLKEAGGDWCRILNLGNEDAWKYCYDLLSNYIEELHIDCYRQDFNIDPLCSWRANDEEDRRGMSEIKHINGLYRLWDALLEKFPRLLIDNCASGGKRLDIEMTKRSVPLWRSDYQCAADYPEKGSQCHNLTFSQWLPYSGTGSGRIYEEYRLRSAYAAGLTTNYFYVENESACFNAENIAFLKKYSEEYLKIRPYFAEDFYPLTEVSDQTDVWCAMQWNRPQNQDGMVEVFRRETSPYETATFLLKNLEKDKTYLFTDLDGGTFTVSGKDLTENGLQLTIKEKKKAKIYLYKTI